MKRISSFLLAACLIFPTIGCSSEKTEPAAPAAETESSEAAAPAEGAETPAEGAETPAEGAAEAPAE